MEYVELHCLSNFSFLQAASHPEELVEQAIVLGYQGLAITDECSVAGAVRAWVAAKDQPLQIIVGSEFRFQGATLVLLAMDRQGYGQLCRLITECRRRAGKGEYQLDETDLTTGLDRCLLLYKPVLDHATALKLGCRLVECFHHRCWILVERLLDAQDQLRYRKQQQLAAELGVRCVAANGVRMHHPSRQPLLDTLTAIRHGCTVSQAGKRLLPNAESHLRSFRKLQHLYKPSELAETSIIAALCTFDLGSLRYEYPAEITAQGVLPDKYLRQLVAEGEVIRFPDGVPAVIRQQIDKELALIAELNYAPFFLTIHDIVRFARSRSILCQGRGSAANSVVCYCLQITEVDPREVSLLFERFLSRERNEPPDIDVDFEHERREEVIQYIYQKYGRDRAGLAATVISYRAKSAIRDVGKALGFDDAYLTWLLNQLDRRDTDYPWLNQLRDLAADQVDARYLSFVSRVEEILGFPRHLSQHVGGFVISAGPLWQLVPVENAAMEGRTVIQWNKDDLEALGLLKVDVLALGMLSAIRKTLQLLAGQGASTTIQAIPRDDPATYDMLCRADSIGVFQVESRAQMNMLPRLKPRNYYDLVIEVAIVRPGPIQGDMVHPYLKRRDGIEAVDYPSADVAKVLKRTLGVPIFQEQVISLAMVAAGFSGGEADQLRRAMAAWRRTGNLRPHQQKLIDGMLERGYSHEFALRICRQIEGFGEYGFPESHAASFALLVYVSAWLKCHHPAAFCCGLLNSQPMGFYSPAQLIADVRRHGVEVRPVCVNSSQWDCTLEQQGNDIALRLGFRLIKGLLAPAINELVHLRPIEGFSSIQQMQALVVMDRRSWQLMAAAGAFNAISNNRFNVSWQLHLSDDALPLAPCVKEEKQITVPLPNEVEELTMDYRYVGLSLGRHPMELLRERGVLKRCVSSAGLQQCRHGQLVSVAGVVSNRQRPGSASGVMFVTLEDEQGQINVVVWSATAKAQRQALLASTVLRVSGVFEREGEVCHVVAGRLEDLSNYWHDLKLQSRDFK